MEEPTEDHCLDILKGLKKRYEDHHRVEIEEHALEAAVKLASRYVNDRFLPDKAIDVLDEACSKVSLRGFKLPDNIAGMEAEVEELTAALEDAIRRGDIPKASQIHKEQEAAEKKLSQVKKRFRKKNQERQLVVTEEDIAEVEIGRAHV